MEKEHIVFMKTNGLYLEVTLFYLIKEGLLKCDLYRSQGGLYSDVALIQV